MNVYRHLLVPALLASAALTMGAPAGARVSAPTHPLIVALGDSITYGWLLPEPATQNYAALYADRVGVDIVNLAVPGYTCAQVRLRLSKMPPGATTVILNCGTNDIGGFGAERGGVPNGHHRIAPATRTALLAAEKDFRDIVSIVRRKEPYARIIAVTVRRWQRMTAPEDRRFVEDIIAWNTMVLTAPVHPVDISRDPRMYDPAYIQPDLIHPNVDGNSAIADDVYAVAH